MTGNTNRGIIRGSILNDIWSFFKPIPWPRLKKKIDKQLERNKNVPSNATIRQEYVKCGKWDCPRCEHGPYYYAYWKENGKLRKKYIGEYLPSMKDQTN